MTVSMSTPNPLANEIRALNAELAALVRDFDARNKAVLSVARGAIEMLNPRGTPCSASQSPPPSPPPRSLP